MNRRQNIFTLILFSAMMWNVFYVPLTYAFYYLDQSDFIAQFCENIDKPELKCNGKCHLEEVSKKDATNDNAPSKMIVTKNIVLYVQEKESINFGFISFIKKQNIGYNNLYSFSIPFLLDHPPQELV